MTIYIIYLVLIGIQSLFFYRNGKLRKENFNIKDFLILCCMELIFIAGLRGYNIGADTEVYLRAIDYYGKMSVSELLRADIVYPFDFEIGYFLLTKLCCLIGFGKTTFLFVVAIITYIPVFKLIKQHSSNAYLSILCYFAFGFFTYSLGLFRQMIAVSIVICGLNSVVERKLVKYLVIIGIAMTFHTTALVGILLYILYGVKWQRIISWVIPVEFGLLFFGRYIVLLLTRIFPQYAGYVGGKYDVQGGSYLMLFFLNLVFIASILFRHREENKSENIMMCALILAICLQCLGYSMGIFGRLVSYYSIYIIIAIPNFIYNAGETLEKGGRGVMTLLTILCLLTLTILSFSGDNYVVPYYTFWRQ